MEDGPWSQKILRRVKRWTHLIKALSGYLALVQYDCWITD